MSNIYFFGISYFSQKHYYTLPSESTPFRITCQNIRFHNSFRNFCNILPYISGMNVSSSSRSVFKRTYFNHENTQKWKTNQVVTLWNQKVYKQLIATLNTHVQKNKQTKNSCQNSLGCLKQLGWLIRKLVLKWRSSSRKFITLSLELCLGGKIV